MIFTIRKHVGNLKGSILMCKEEIIINNLDFNVHYQPIVSTKTGEIVSAEALIRIKDQQMIPSDLIMYAEDHFLVDRIDKYVLTQVCDMISRHDLSNSGLSFHVNLSPIELKDDDLLKIYCDIVDRFMIPRDCIMLELLETKDMHPKDYVKLQKFKDSGFKVSMDDYGTGFSGAMRIMDFDFDCIKISKQIFERVFTNDKAWYLYEEIIKSVKNTNVSIVQEGVETAAQYFFIKSAGIDFAQGYYINKALSEQIFIETIEGRRRMAS